MRHIIELSSVQAREIRTLVNDGKYEDAQSFILTAVENQLYLEKQPLDHTGPMVFSLAKSAREEPVSSLPVPTSLPSLELLNIVTVQERQPNPLDSKILWALYNRIFPIKISLRVLLNILKSDPNQDGYIDLARVQDTAAEEAQRLRRELVRVDKKSHRMPGEKLSTGLPRAAERSRDRFKLHFVGSVNSKNSLEGAPAILRFVNIRKNEEGLSQIGITEAGLQFAIMKNPVLDKSDYTHVLSKEESDFYLKHISNNLKEEYFLSIDVLKAIGDGHVTPDELMKVVLDVNPNIKNAEAQAIRSSLISRLSELGLLTRKRSGLNVTYALTKRGRAMIVTDKNRGS